MPNIQSIGNFYDSPQNIFYSFKKAGNMIPSGFTYYI